MNEKKYLRWYNKVGYGSGDVAGNVVYALLSAFTMIYLTDTAGLNAGVIGTLMMLSKFFDGFSDLVFGALLDKTQTRMGKARPWMLWAFVGCAAMIIAIFAIPTSLGDTAKYAWFFIAYTLLNAVFFTANNIAYSALTALITKNSSERVQMGSIRFMFAFGTSLVIQTVTVKGVELLGGGAEGWRAIAIIYALVGLAVNTLSVMSVRELSPAELAEAAEAADDEAGRAEGAAAPEKVTLRESGRLLLANRYYLIILVVFIMTQMFTATLNMGIYFMTYILGNANLLGGFAWAINIPLIVGLLFTPAVVARAGGMYRVNIVGYAVAVAGRLGVVAAGYMGNLWLMLFFSGVASLGMSPLQGTLNALIAEASEHTFLRSGKRIDGLMFSCTSLGVKIGSGLGTALAGWLLAASGYVANAPEQAGSVITMLYVMYLWIPAVANAIILALLWRLDVEKANARLRARALEADHGGDGAGSEAQA
ncbi:MFS transporter [Actinomyces howellii]|uniref:Inner membrane symporter yicJ n=1 Tax=Actinomyces howellii TaxID=52771 RepID=A0A3S4SNC9_9ACTO|nr:glycoside-pentoside-hexuronide (GPH):cation symporter [Actinomyces howellii]VEG28660.1 Inner membrane symporter yicJ [Actinomyces howellii]